jgi:hypothetical protein
MTRVPPSQHVREAIAALLADGQVNDAEIASTLIRVGAQRVVQELLQQEVTDQLDRGRYERTEATEQHRGYRNGYRPRQLRTAEGRIPVWRPRFATSPGRLRVGCGGSCAAARTSCSGWSRRCMRMG